jgi:uncharacterized protein (DUF1330 family)
MAAYVVLLRESPIRDQAEMNEYYRIGQEGGGPPPNMKILAMYGAQTALEGSTPDASVILEFPTVEEAREWYYGPYQKAAAHRLKAADYRSYILEGM